MAEEEKNKEIISFGDFGICPRCGRLMGMLESVFTMYGLTYNGRYPNRIFTEEREITYACTCGARYDMVRTPLGILPKQYRGLDSIMQKKVDNLNNPIGYVEKENESND